MKLRYSLLFLLVFLFICIIQVAAQNTPSISGIVVHAGKPLEMVNVAIKGAMVGTQTDKNGYFELKIIPKTSQILVFTCVGYKTKEFVLDGNHPKSLKIELDLSDQNLSEVEIIERTQRTDNLIKIDPKIIHALPDVGGGIEGLVKTQLGVKSNNELSSQYTVRGGNFDENLVYVNDIEIFRPFLIRSGQQEGLSFINPDMVKSVYFSAGGFEAKYGDKMSSVLDVTYKQPDRASSAFSASLLGSSIQTEGVLAHGKLTYNAGYRYKTSKYILNSLETTGEYSPSFMDFQTFITYRFNQKSSFSFLSNYSSNVFDFVPRDQRTSFGTLSTMLELYVAFNGHERDEYSTWTNALSFDFAPTSDLDLKFIASAYQSTEKEKFDIQGRYSLNSLSRLDGQTLGDSSLALGIGAFLNHARNSLDASVYNFQHKGSFHAGRGLLQWGVRLQREVIESTTNEWKMIDSAGYSLPNLSDGVHLAYAYNGAFDLITMRYSAFLQHTQPFKLSEASCTFNIGIRTSYSDQNKEYLMSPRLGMSFKPNWKNDWLFRASVGVYDQPPFYKEFQFLDNSQYSSIKANKSYHYILGGDFYFRAWDRPFKLVCEAYYKQMDVIPYQIDNLRIKYMADRRATAYSTGLDFKVNGEFVKGAESWLSLSVMQSRQKLDGVNSEVPLPTDQLVNAGLFFQDYFPGNDSYKINLMLLYGSPLPFGPPDQLGLNTSFRMPSYNRADVGFTKEFISAQRPATRGYFKKFKELSLTGEIFNLFGIDNTVSYLWLTVVPPANSTEKPEYHQLAVPNRLTARRLNLKLVARF